MGNCCSIRNVDQFLQFLTGRLLTEREAKLQQKMSQVIKQSHIENLGSNWVASTGVLP
jgi:hypothetical protein